MSTYNGTVEGATGGQPLARGISGQGGEVQANVLNQWERLMMPASGSDVRGSEPSYGVVLFLLVLLGLIQIHRVHQHHTCGGKHGRNRELVILFLVFLGMGVFWMDVRRACFFEGILKLLAVIVVANLLVPCIWTVPRLEEENEEDDVRLQY